MFITAKEKESLEQLLKKYKKKLKETGLTKEARRRAEGYTKPSKKQREIRKKAIYTARYKRENE